MKLQVQITSEGDKRTIYGLREELLRSISNFNIKCELTISDNEGLIETSSISTSGRSVPTEEVIDAEIIEVKLVS
jgi:hypothetical protein